MSSLKQAVGKDKANCPDDVRKVQNLLNASIAKLIPLVKLIEDGRFGPKTAAAIVEFQRRVMHLHVADGCVDPNGPTLRALETGSTAKAAPPHVSAFINMAVPAARKVKLKWGVPIAALIAQSAQETGWGRSVVGNAYFGIKGKSPSGASQSFGTSEVIGGKVVHVKDEFRAYQDFADSADDYGRFLNENPRYKPALAVKSDPIKFVEAVARAGYATDPDYAAKVTSIIRTYKLEEYDR